MKQPDWKIWQQIPEIRLIEGVALLLSIDPKELKPKHRHPHGKAIDYQHYDTEFLRLATVLERIAASSNPGESGLRIIDFPPCGLQSCIRTADFIDWARHVKLRIPPQLEDFPAVAARTGPWPWGGYRTRMLDVLTFAAGRLFVNCDRTDANTVPTKKQVFEHLKERYAWISKRESDAIFTVLVPENVKPGRRKK